MTSIFILQETGYCRGLPRPFSTEEKANEALDWLMANEGGPGDEWVIEEYELNFLEPVDHPNHTGRKLLPVSRIRIVRKAKIRLNKCPQCGCDTKCSDLCSLCRFKREKS